MPESETTSLETLAARVDALVVAGRALQENVPEARETIRKIARSIRSCSGLPGLHELLEPCRWLEETPNDAPRTLEIIREVASQPSVPKIPILIVDDDPLMARLLQGILEAPNREILLAATGAAAEAVLESKEVSVILLDLVLPDSDGRKLIVRYRERPQTALVPILVVSGSHAPQVQSECYALGADGFFEKPLDLPAVAAAVAGNIQRRTKSHGDVRTDPLTGLANRAAFREVFQWTLSLQSRTRQKTALAILDLDNFKIVNDTHGHVMGDEVLHRIGALIPQRLRKSDILARWGGDEFTILLPSTDAAGAVRAVDSALAAVQKEPFSTKDGCAFSITFSAGVTEVSPQDPLEECVSRADGFLYQAKGEGKNRVISEGIRPAPAERSILVAEDDEITAALLKHRLQREGFRVLHVSSGSEALELAKHQALALAIFDVQMPEMDGFQALERLRQSPRTGHLPVIMLTGLGNERHIVRGFELGASDYVVKPFSPVELLARVRRLLERRG